MRRWIQAAVVGAALLTSRVAEAQPYNFLVDYFGSGNAVQAAGSDNILGTNILPGNSFFWRISAVGGQWRTTAAVGLSLPMAFTLNECGQRIGDYTLNLFSGSTNVLTQSVTDEYQICAHLGAGYANLSNNLVWDRMELNYVLISAVQFPIIDPNNPVPVNSSIASLLSFSGAPETYNTDVLYEATTVPEPATFALMGLGIGVIGVVARRRR